MEKKKLSDIAQVVSGGTPSTKEDKYWNGGIPWITPKDLSNYNSIFISKGERKITEEGLRNSSAYIVPEGTVLFSSRAPIGYLAIAKKNLTTNQGFKNLVVKAPNDNLFVYYLLKNNIKYIESQANGSTFKEISAKVFRDLEFEIPSIDNQRKISNILFSLDSKIELNNQIISNLEELASTLFKRWFVDFEFLDKNGNPYKSSGGKMVDSELGEIPEGWKVTTINNVYDIKYGKQMPISELHDTGYPVHGANGSIIGYTDSYMYNKEVALVTCRGNGSGDVFRSLRNSFVTNNLLIFEPLDGIYNVDYTRFLLINNNTYNYQTGSAQPQITIKNISKMKIIVPNIDTLKLFNNKIESIMNQQILMSENNSVLTSIRDSLLPKLLSGEIELPEDEEV